MQLRRPEQHEDEANRRVADGSGGQTLGFLVLAGCPLPLPCAVSGLSVHREGAVGAQRGFMYS